MRGAIGIASQLLQLPDAPRLKGIGDGGSHAGMVLMHVHALQFQWLTIEQETSVSIELDITDARGGFVDIAYFSVDLYRCFCLVQIWMGGAP